MAQNTISFSVTQVAEEIEASPDTVRRYTTEFSPFLSAEATPAPGAIRTFTRRDVEVIRVIRMHMRSGKTYEEVRTLLTTAEIPDPEEPEEEPPTGTSMIEAGALSQLTATIRKLAVQDEAIDRLQVAQSDLATDVAEKVATIQAQVAEELAADRRQRIESEKRREELQERHNQRLRLMLALMTAIVILVGLGVLLALFVR